MLQIVSAKLAAEIPGSHLQIDDTERKIFDFIKSAAQQMPSHPTVRVAGGWVRDKLLGKPSKDIDITVDTMPGIDFGKALFEFARRPEIRHRYGENFVGTVKDTEARPEQIKNLAVAFVRINGIDIEILPVRCVEEYKPGNRNPITIGIPELNKISKQPGGIPAYLQSKYGDLYSKLAMLPPIDRNNALKVAPILDAHRRDLTINALFYDINTGQIEDYTRRAFNDLATMTLQTPLDPVKTFTDDPLRVLRVLRFHAKYGTSKISPEVIEGMKNPDVQFQLSRKISNPQETQGIVVERTAIELRKIMQGQQPEAAIRIMYETGLLAKLLNLPPDFQPLEMDQRNSWHSLSLIDHTLQVLKHVNQLSKQFGLSDEYRMMMNLGALFHDLGKLDPRTHKDKPDGTRGYMGDPSNPNAVPHQVASYDVFNSFAKSLQLSNHETQFIGDIVIGHMKPHDHVENQMTDKSLRRYIRENPNWVFQYIHAMADALSKNTYADESLSQPYKQSLERLKSLAPSADTFGQQPKQSLLLRGDEIARITGLPMEPPKGMIGHIKVVQNKIQEALDENPHLTKDDAIRIVQSMVSSGELDAYKNRV